MERLQKSKRKSVSPVISVLLIIIIAVAASLVVYAWVMGYVGFSTQKAGKALMIQSVTFVGNTLNVYVQNVGQGSVEFDPNSGIFIDSIQYSCGVLSPLNPGDTATITVTPTQPVGDRVKIKVVTTEGTFSEITWTVPPGTGAPAVLDHFDFDTIASPQTVGVNFVITIRAKDSSNNLVTGYTGTNALTASTGVGTITPTSTGNFVGGIWTNTVTLSAAGAVVTLGTSGAGKVGTSNTFTVNAPAPYLHHFEFDTISSPQTSGVAFSVTITAIDQNGATLTSYSGTNTLSVTPGTISPTSTTAFSGGVWSDLVTVTGSGTGVRISTAAVSDPSKTGISDPFDVSSAPPAFDHFTMTGYPASVLKGQSFGDVVVTACDQYGDPFTSYAGDVYFESSDPLVVLPYDALSKYTYVPATDNGVYTFDGFMLNTVGSWTITVMDGTKFKVSDPITVNATPILASFAIDTISTPQTAGTAFSITITAKDQYGNTLTGYTGTVHFTSSDGQAVLPADYQFVVGDSGVHTFTNGVTLKTSGPQTITVADGPVSKTSDSITVDPAGAATLTVSGFPDPVTAGTAGSVTVTAKDAYGNVATGYTGTVHFTSSDGQAVLPADYQFLVGDSGTHTFTDGVTLKTVGEQSITATDTVTGSITGSQTAITVNPGAAATLTVSGFPDPVTAGTAGSVTVTAKDAYGNVATGYTGTVHFTSSDGSATLPSDYPFVGGDNGVKTFTNGVTLRTVGEQSITATDTVTGSITGSQIAITVNPATPSNLIQIPGFEIDSTWTETVSNLQADRADRWYDNDERSGSRDGRTDSRQASSNGVAYAMLSQTFTATPTVLSLPDSNTLTVYLFRRGTATSGTRPVEVRIFAGTTMLSYIWCSDSQLPSDTSTLKYIRIGDVTDISTSSYTSLTRNLKTDWSSKGLSTSLQISSIQLVSNGERWYQYYSNRYAGQDIVWDDLELLYYP